MPPNPQPVNAYLRTKVLTAGPEELRLMLLDGAIKFAVQGRDGLLRKDYEASFNGISQCRDIICELMTSIRPEHDPALAERVLSVYSFIFSEITQASMDKDTAKLTKVIELIMYERETWSLLIQKLAEERGSPTRATTGATTGATTAAGSAHPTPHHANATSNHSTSSQVRAPFSVSA